MRAADVNIFCQVIVQPVTTAVTVQSMPEVPVSIQSAGEVGLMSILSQAAEMRQVIPGMAHIRSVFKSISY